MDRFSRNRNRTNNPNTHPRSGLRNLFTRSNNDQQQNPRGTQAGRTADALRRSRQMAEAEATREDRCNAAYMRGMNDGLRDRANARSSPWCEGYGPAGGNRRAPFDDGPLGPVSQSYGAHVRGQTYGGGGRGVQGRGHLGPEMYSGGMAAQMAEDREHRGGGGRRSRFGFVGRRETRNGAGSEFGLVDGQRLGRGAELRNWVVRRVGGNTQGQGRQAGGRQTGYGDTGRRASDRQGRWRGRLLSLADGG